MDTNVQSSAPLPSVAGMPGLRFRHFRGVDADIPGMGAANQAARSAAGELQPIDLDDMRTNYRHLTNCDPDRDICVLESDGVIGGYSRVYWEDLDEGIRLYLGLSLVRPELRGPEVDGALLGWSEARRRGIAAEHRLTGDGAGRPAILGADSFDDDRAAIDLLERSGYERHRRFATMIRPDLERIAAVPLPEGLAIRPIVRDDGLLARLFDAEVEAFRDHDGARDATESDRAVFVEQANGDLFLWVVAFDGEEVAGGVRNTIKVTPNGLREGWLDPVYTRRPWRRRGLARALIAESLRRLRARGADRAALGVDMQNPNQALSLYESCGFRVRSSSTEWRKPLRLEDDPVVAAGAPLGGAR